MKRQRVAPATRDKEGSITPNGNGEAFEVVAEIDASVATRGRRPRITSDLEMISPERARDLLATDLYERQRNISRDHVADLADAIQRGQYSQQAIVLCNPIGTDLWRLTNGQHRLWAIIKAEQGVEEIVIRKWEMTEEEIADEYGRTDRGKRRQVADALRAHGIGEEHGLTQQQVNMVSGALNLILPGFAYTKPAIRTRLHLNNQDERVREMQRWLPAAQRYFKAIQGAKKGRYRHLVLAATLAVGLVTMQWAGDKAEEFWRRVAQDTPSEDDDPVLVLLHLFRDNTAERGKPPLYARRVASCWNAFYEGRTLTRTRLPSSDEAIYIAGTHYKGKGTSSTINPSVDS